MATYRNRFGPHNPDETYVDHAYAEQLVDLGEVQMNFARAGDDSSPALVLIPGQTESWWGYESAMALLADRFEVFAVDLRGQGRSSRTPGRYTIDNMGGDVVRFIDEVVGRPTIVSGLSSGGVVAAWLSAFARPGQVVGACYEDPPLYASQVAPAVGPGIRQAIGPMFHLWSTFLGDQWCIGDWEGMVDAAPDVLPPWLASAIDLPAEPPQTLREYDPEWGRAFWTGTVCASCDHDEMLRAVKVPVLFTHHFRLITPTGLLVGALSDLQAERVRARVGETGVPVDHRSFESVGHSMHGDDPELFVATLTDWIDTL